MRVDELVSLLEDLLGEVSLADIRQGAGPIGDLSDEGFVLLARFLAGERPAGPVALQPREFRPLREPREPLEHEQRLKDALPRNVKLTEDDEIEFTSGEFDGITLP